MKNLTKEEQEILDMAKTAKTAIELGMGQITNRLGAEKAQSILPSAIGVVGLAEDYIRKSRRLEELEAKIKAEAKKESAQN